jgi:hypothetical protein
VTAGGIARRAVIAEDAGPVRAGRGGAAVRLAIIYNNSSQTFSCALSNATGPDAGSMSAAAFATGCSVQGISNGLDVLVTPIDGAPPISAQSTASQEAVVTGVTGGAFEINISDPAGLVNAPYDFIVAP